MADENIQAAIRYSQQLEKDWSPPPPTMINFHKLICHPSVTISSVAQNGRRKITISGDETELEALHQYFISDFGE